MEYTHKHTDKLRKKGKKGGREEGRKISDGYQCLRNTFKTRPRWDFPCSPMVKTLYLQWGGQRFDPW